MKNIKRIRKSRKMSQSQLAELANVSLRTLQHYEQGTKDINNANAMRLYQISQVLHCTIEELLEIDEKSPLKGAFRIYRLIM